VSDLSQESPLWREWAESRHSVQQMREELDRLRAENARLLADHAAALRLVADVRAAIGDGGFGGSAVSDPKHTFSVEDDGSVRIEMPSGVGVDVDARGTTTSRIIAAALRQLIAENAAILAANRDCLTHLREPTEDECRRIANEFLILGGPDELAGRVMFNAVREVMKK
jgi:hypothetical protein